MALLVDYSQTVISNMMGAIRELGGDASAVDEDFLRHMILNSLRKYNRKYGKKYGKPILCVDSRNYWRRSIFPEYKAHRAKKREELDIDWDMVFRMLEEIKNVAGEFFGYKVIEVNGAEADDIIGVIAKYKHLNEPIMILSSDSDFKQLQRYKNVSQYSTIQEQAVTCDSPVSFLREKFFRGDKKDGIPNFLMRADFFVTKEGKERQKSIMAKKLVVWMTQKPEEFCDDDMLERYQLNERLIDLSFTPDDIRDSILREYETVPVKDAMKMMEYMQENRLRNLLGVIEEF